MEQGDVEDFGQVDVAVVDGTWVVRLAGEISLELRPRLDVVLAQIAAEQHAVDVDLGAVTFMDSSGLGFLAQLGVQNPTRVRVLNAHGMTRDLLTMTGLPKLLRVEPT